MAEMSKNPDAENQSSIVPRAQSLTRRKPVKLTRLAATELLGPKTRAEKAGLKRNTTQRMYVYAWADFARFLQATADPDAMADWVARRKLTPEEREEAVDWLDAHITEISHHEVLAYRSVLQTEAGLAPSTITGRLSALQFLFTIAQREGLIASNPADSKLVRRVKDSRSGVKHVLTMEEVQQVIAAHPPEDPVETRNRMLFVLLAWSGMRRQEASELRVEDIEQEGNAMLLHLRRKGAKRDSILVPAKLEAALTEYIEAMEIDGFMFPSMRRTPSGEVYVFDRPLTPDSITHIIRAMTERALGVAYGPHRLRHFFGNEAWERGASIEMVQNYLGHSSQKTTLGYLELKPRRERSAAELIDLEDS